MMLKCKNNSSRFCKYILLFYSLFSFGQKEVTSLHINQNTIVVGLDYIFNVKVNQEKKEPLYVVENTIFYTTQEFTIVTIKGNDKILNRTKNIKNKVLLTQNSQSRKKAIKNLYKTQLKQIPFPFEFPTKQNQSEIYAISIINIAPSNFQKLIEKNFIVNYSHELSFIKSISINQSNTFYNQNNKLFKIKIKLCNRPPPLLRC